MTEGSSPVSTSERTEVDQAEAFTRPEYGPRIPEAREPALPAVNICFPFSGDIVGGSHISALKLIGHLDATRYRPHVVIQRPDNEIAGLLRSEGIPFTSPLRWTESPLAAPVTAAVMARTLIDAMPIVRFLRRERIDIVHTNDGRTHAPWAFPTRLAGAKLVWHHRGDPTSTGLRIAAPLFANHVVAVSQFSLPPPGLFSAARRATVVHSPFDTSLEVDRNEARAKLLEETGLSPETLCIGYSGWFIERKRPLLFIETIARLQQMMPERPVAGIMFGKAEQPEMAARIQEQIDRLGIRDKIRLMGWKTPGAFWIAACDQLLVPAVREPFGRTLIEAMLVGTAVVAIRSGGNVEALRDGRLGVLVEQEDDAEALSQACLELARKPARALAITKTAAQDARARFGLDQHCRAIEAIYEQLVGDRKAHIGDRAHGPRHC